MLVGVIIQSSLTNGKINMKMLPVNFSATQTLKISDVVEMTGTTTSKVDRQPYMRSVVLHSMEVPWEKPQP